MNKLKKKWYSSDDDLNFWQPASDMFSGLLLILILVILLLGLYLVHMPDNDSPEKMIGEPYPSTTPTPLVMVWYHDNDGGGGGRWGTPSPSPTPTITPSATPTATPTPTMTPTPVPYTGYGHGGNGGGHEEGEGRKAAVYVELVDAETERTIKEAGVEFELYDQENGLQTLNTYYPVRQSFQKYETTESGTFYLPEKIDLGKYVLHEITAADGYETANNQAFTLDEMYDWSDPYTILVPVSPAKNVIRIQMTDAETGRPISGGSFEAVAAENIFTSDGTMRYREGQTACIIECDEEGYGVSEELYLGAYRLHQRDIPEYYAGLQEDLEIAVERKGTVDPPAQVVANNRTRIRLTLTDELYDTRTIQGAAFEVVADRTASEEEETLFTTNGSGQILLQNLRKGTTYHIRQTEGTETYLWDSADRPVTVDLAGYISGETEAELNLTNRMIRVSIGITDEFSNIQIPNVNLGLFKANGEMVRAWTTTSAALSFNDLTPGNYFLIRDGDTEKRYDITVANRAEIQEINIYSSYLVHYLLMAGGAILLLVIILVAILLLRRRRRKQHDRGSDPKSGQSRNPRETQLSGKNAKVSTRQMKGKKK